MAAPKLTLELRLRDGYGRTHGVIVREVTDDVAFQGERAAEEFSLGTYSIGAQSQVDAFAAATTVLKVRELRRSKLRDFAANMGTALADFLQDREGWHGLDRQEATDKIAREDL